MPTLKRGLTAGFIVTHMQSVLRFKTINLQGCVCVGGGGEELNLSLANMNGCSYRSRGEI